MDASNASIRLFLQHLNWLRLRLDQGLRARTPGPLLHLLLRAIYIWLIIYLHGVAWRITIPLAYLFTLMSDLSRQLFIGWQGVLAQQVLAHPDALQFGQRHDRAQRLEQAEEEDIAILRMENAMEELQLVVLRLNHFRLKEWERHFVAGAIDNRVELLARPVAEDDAIAIELLDIGLHFHPPVSNTREDIRTDCRMGMQRLMIGFGESILCQVSHLEAQNHPHQLALDNGGEPLREDRRLIQRFAEQIFRDDVEAAPHREIGHDGDARSFNGDVHCRVAEAQH